MLAPRREEGESVLPTEKRGVVSAVCMGSRCVDGARDTIYWSDGAFAPMSSAGYRQPVDDSASRVKALRSLPASWMRGPVDWPGCA
jgi:hypothetical protein